MPDNGPDSEVDREHVDRKQKNALQSDCSADCVSHHRFPINQIKICLYGVHIRCNLVHDRAHEWFR